MPLTMIPSYRSWSTAIYLQVAMTLVMANKTQPNILFLLSDDVGMADTEAVDPAMCLCVSFNNVQITEIEVFSQH